MVEAKAFVILGDVVSSKKIDDKTQFQKKIDDAIKTVNLKYSDSIYADFKILKGIDEIGSVLKSVANIYEILISISECIYPIQMRFVVVFGEIEVGFESKDVSLMDGSAFHQASKEINELKESDSLFSMITGNDEIDKQITPVINIIFVIRGRWSPNQIQAAREYRQLKNQKEVAQKLGLTQPAISKLLKNIHWKDFERLRTMINSVFAKYDKSIEKKF